MDSRNREKIINQTKSKLSANLLFVFLYSRAIISIIDIDNHYQYNRMNKLNRQTSQLSKGEVRMIIVTNTIKVEKGAAEHVIRQFTGENGDGHPTKDIAEVEGFLGFELWHSQPEDEDYEEVVVTSKWESEEAQRNWVKSDSFKKAHGRTKDSRAQREDRKGIVGNEIARFKVVHVQNPVITEQ